MIRMHLYHRPFNFEFSYVNKNLTYVKEEKLTIIQNCENVCAIHLNPNICDAGSFDMSVTRKHFSFIMAVFL